LAGDTVIPNYIPDNDERQRARMSLPKVLTDAALKFYGLK